MFMIPRGPEPRKRSREEARINRRNEDGGSGGYHYNPAFNPLNLDPMEQYRRQLLDQLADIYLIDENMSGQNYTLEQSKEIIYNDLGFEDIPNILRTMESHSNSIKRNMKRMNN